MKEDIPNIVKKYLLKFGLTGWELLYNKGNSYKLIIVVPAIKELENIKRLLFSLLENDNTYFDKTLVVFVINSIVDSPKEITDENELTLQLLKSIINKEKLSDNELNKVSDSWLNIGLVDISTCGKQMPLKDGGVGLARKIGLDLALESFDYNELSKNILVCLDADCTVENNYITEIYNYFNNNSCSAAYVQFEHLLENDKENNLAIICYEIFLRYYVLGLRIAKSTYASHTIGSTMACDAESYTKIQGMNKKKAAEDFYFMEKLSKITKIHKINNTKVYPSSRGSWRVPFGTGKSVIRFLAKQQNEYLLYSPKSFCLLKDWLQIFNTSDILTSEEYLRKAKLLNTELHQFLVQNNFEESWNKILNNSKTDEQINLQKTIWFDGFRTLKFIHHLRDTVFPQENMFNAIDELFNLIGKSEVERKKENIPPFEIQLEYLKALRNL